jgi:hypothetical protein
VLACTTGISVGVVPRLIAGGQFLVPDALLVLPSAACGVGFRG